MPVKRTRNVSRINGARRVSSAIEFSIGGNANGRQATKRVECLNWKTGKNVANGIFSKLPLQFLLTSASILRVVSHYFLTLRT